MEYKIIIWSALKKIGNLSFAITLLLIISAISILGTIIEQDQNLEYYKEHYPIHSTKPFEINWQIIQSLQLSTLYTNILFISLLTIFCFSLVICTLSTQLPNLKNARRWKFKKQVKEQSIISEYITPTIISPSSIIYFLNQTNYYTFHQSFYLYNYKGLLGRLAPVFVHISIINILLGSLLGLLSGISFQEMIPTGEFFHLKNIVKSGQISFIPKNLIGTINDFNIEYHNTGLVKQFYSNISILNQNSKLLVQKTISVNNPLYIRGFTFYQTDWAINGLTLQIGLKEKIQVPISKFINNNKTLWVSSLSYNTNRKIIFVISGLNTPIACYDDTGALLQEIKINETYVINHISIKIVDLITSTGLQIKTDQGIPIIYFNFFILMISTITSYTSYSQIWLINHENKLQLLGSTNRAQFNFEEDIMILKKMIITLY
jgi:cytochrome c biogenesis protein